MSKSILKGFNNSYMSMNMMDMVMCCCCAEKIKSDEFYISDFPVSASLGQ